MKNKRLIIGIIILSLTLIPIPFKLKDGGTTEYKAILYTVTKLHRLSPNSKTGYEDGLKVEVLGIQVYNKSNQIKDNITIDKKDEITKSFEATIIEAKEDYIIVRPDEGTTELKSSDKIRIKITRPTSGINDFYVAGNKIIITYNGNINESYPAQIDAIKIKLKS